MLIPRFSIRWLLGLTTASGVFFYLVMLATRGQAWAIAISVAVASLLATAFLQITVFGLAWLVTSWLQRFRRSTGRTSPFASAGPPEQVIPPVDID